MVVFFPMMLLSKSRQAPKSPAQVILRWEIQQDFVVLTKTTHPQRMQENAEIFDFTLSPDEMKQIDKLDQEKHSIWYDKFKWSGNPDGVDDYIGKPGSILIQPISYLYR